MSSRPRYRESESATNKAEGGAGTQRCPICETPAPLLPGTVAGYLEGTEYRAAECPRCRARFAVPRDAPDDLYDAIYAHAQDLPGYDGYAAVASASVGYSDPLKSLGQSDENPWVVAKAVAMMSERLARPLRILDIGCGLGYMVFALNAAGHDARGFDISAEAVQQARDRFGPYYGVLGSDETSAHGEHDLVLLIQVLEHVLDPLATLRSTLAHVADGGSLLVTVPNKAPQAQHLWATVPPPVHRWWFENETLSCMAAILDCEVSFIDTAPYYREHVTYHRPAHRGHKLAADGTPLRHRSGTVPRARSLLRPLKAAILGTLGLERSRWSTRVSGETSRICAALLRPSRHGCR